ncbi:tumor necrosis factor receptor superfamily member 5 isoform X1 [Gadus morhua]|uniref:Tumor necrosis factor receptor superfamily member 5-like n=1 Tax=Gadus morhua TaxID=8049 RepID=A0A8C5B8X5_GADMO|nr:tumor necrosis factor receptor superfamily member 5-like isoform X1 [Gadus morhua]
MGVKRMNCNPNEYVSQETKCCARCPAGQYVGRECDSTRGTECLDCEAEVFTDKQNGLSQCLLCAKCDNKNQTVVKECKAHENRQCGCNTGFYCHDASCEQCVQITSCPPGQGVRVQATVTNDTICGPCDSGMFSNVSDRTSPCKAHTSCEEQGRPLEMPGTDIADAICGPFKSGCSWELPAGLWSGLALNTLLLFLGLIFWRTRRRSRKAVFSSVPADPGVSGGGRPGVHLPPHAPSPHMDIHCQESCDCPSHITVDFKCCSPDRVVENGLHITQPEWTSFPNPFNHEDQHGNGRPDQLLGASLGLHSEPQEDEWCGM